MPNNPTKKCKLCKLAKSVSQFHKDAKCKDGLHSSCKTCKAAYRKIYHAKNKEKLNEQCKIYHKVNKLRINIGKRNRRRTYKQLAVMTLGYNCSNCGIDLSNNLLPAAEFHHVNPDEKERDPGSFIRLTFNLDQFLDRVRPELDRCILLCRNCHRELHYNLNSSKKLSKRAIERRVKKQELIEHFGGICAKCSYNKNPAAFDFHHRDLSVKSFEIGKGITKGSSLDELTIEAEKCDMLCCNCHAQEHATI